MTPELVTDAPWISPWTGRTLMADVKHHTGALLDERWTRLLGRKVWRNADTGETWVETDG